MSKLDDLKQSSLDTAAAAKARISQSYGKAKAATSDAAARGRDHVQHLGEKAGPLVARGKDKAGRARTKLDETAQAQPLTLLAGAVAFGALIGTLIPGRRRRTPPSE
jgi:hypothetical protein